MSYCCAVCGSERFFEALATAPSWSLEGTGVSEDAEDDVDTREDDVDTREAEAKEVAETSVVVPAARAPNDSAKNDSAKNDSNDSAKNDSAKKKSPTRPPSHLAYANGANGASD